MSRINPELEAQLHANPEATLQVIIRVEGEMDARQVQLEANGLNITRRLRLIHGFSATAQGTALLKVMSYEWIVSVELDQEVKTM